MNQCLGCGASIADNEVACPRCQQPVSKRPAKSRWYHRRWAVIIGISPLALGPFGLPLLWKSPNFSSGEKLAWSLITLGWTVALVWYSAEHIVPVLRQEFEQLNASYQF